MQSRGADVIEVSAGDTIRTPPREWHWHGAAPEHFMTHFTIYEAAADGAETDWGEQVAEAEYRAEPPPRAR
jgi:quercetin dioxygenase-like cupin family protein